MSHSLFFQASACNFIIKESLTQVFFCEIRKTFKNTFFTEHFHVTVPVKIKSKWSQISTKHFIRFLKNNPVLNLWFCFYKKSISSLSLSMCFVLKQAFSDIALDFCNWKLSVSSVDDIIIGTQWLPLSSDNSCIWFQRPN